MIRHIVLFRFSREGGQESFERARQEMKSRLDTLPAKIDVIRSFETGININPIERAWDLALDSVFDSMEDLEKYRVHPAHQEVVDWFGTVKEAAASVDYEF